MSSIKTILILTVIGMFCCPSRGFGVLEYTIVDTGQTRCYDNHTEIEYPKADAAFFGQDAHYRGNQPAYKDHGDGTITDLKTGLMWIQDPVRMTYRQALSGAAACKVGGYSDWRLPSIKELYSLILFSGTDPDPGSRDTSVQTPFMDRSYFKFRYGNAADGDRIIDCQYATSTLYGGTTMGGDRTMFGVNFADGRIKGYPVDRRGPRGEKEYYVLYVRGNPAYGKNDFRDNGDGTVTDNATGLMWMKIDSGHLNAGIKKDGRLNWGQALEWSEHLEFASYSDWRLPNAKELQSIVDYSRCPDVTNSAAIDAVFEATPITNEGGKQDYPFYWTSSSHCGVFRADAAVYVAFGRSLGWMRNHRTGQKELMDVHGAGSQRSDPKSGDPNDFPSGRGPQGDVIRIYNYARCVRGGVAEPCTAGPRIDMKPTSPRPAFGGAPPEPGGQDMRRSPNGRGFVRRLDRNNDGRVSREEFDGPPEHFSRVDRNGDGFVSEEEARMLPPQPRM